MDSNDQLTKYENATEVRAKNSHRLSEMLKQATVTEMINNMPLVVDAIRNIRLAQMEYQNKYDMMQMQVAHNSMKFRQLISSATFRLNSEMTEMQEIRRHMRSMLSQHPTENELKIISRLSDEIGRIHDAMMTEMRFLYSL